VAPAGQIPLELIYSIYRMTPSKSTHQLSLVFALKSLLNPSMPRRTDL
jgi:hypothetical protein